MAATTRMGNLGAFAGSRQHPSRTTKATLPSNWELETGASGCGIPSPWVTICRSRSLPDFPETRCTNIRRSRWNSTISPLPTLSLSARSIKRVSPGKIAGNMLHPVTRRRNRPDERKTSSASSHFKACNSAAERPRIGSRRLGVHVACGLGRVDLAAGQGCGDENLLVAEGWLLVRLFMVVRCERLFGR